MDKLIRLSGLIFVMTLLGAILYALYWLDSNFGPGGVVLTVGAFILVLTFMAGALFMHWHTNRVLERAANFIQATSKSESAVANLLRSTVTLVRDEKKQALRLEERYQQDVLRLSDRRLKAITQNKPEEPDFWEVSEPLKLEDWANSG